MDNLAQVTFVFGLITTILVYIRVEWLRVQVLRNMVTKSATRWLLLEFFSMELLNPRVLNRVGRFWRKKLLGQLWLLSVVVALTALFGWLGYAATGDVKI